MARNLASFGLDLKPDIEFGEEAAQRRGVWYRVRKTIKRLRRRWGHLSQRQKAAISGILLLVVWMSFSLLFTYTYYYRPMLPLRIPEGLAKPPSVCAVNQSCLFAIGGADSGPGTFLPAVEAFNGSVWGAEPMLPPNKFGKYGYGLTTQAVVFAGRIYAVGHSSWGDVHSWDGSDGGAWRREPGLSFRRDGLSLVVYRGRIYATGGKTLCTVISESEDPETTCTRPGWTTPGDGSSREQSDVVESFDPRVDSQWRVECSSGGSENADEGGVGDGAKCMQIERAGHVSAVFQGKIFVVGGHTGLEVELFDGRSWGLLEQPFPTAVYGASIAVFDSKVWVIGGFSYTNIYRSVFSWDGRNFQRKAPISQDRAWATATVYPDCEGRAGCTARMFVLGGSNQTHTISHVESTDGVAWRDEAPLPNRRNRHAALVYARPKEPTDPAPEAAGARRGGRA